MLVSIVPVGTFIVVAAGVAFASPCIAITTLSPAAPDDVIVPIVAVDEITESVERAIPVAPFPNSIFPIFVTVTAFSPYIPVEFSPAFIVPVFPIFVQFHILFQFH